MLLVVPLMPSETLAISMLCLRFCISQMDTPARNAYVQGVVHPDERSAANGVTNVVRSIGASTGPVLAGLLFANDRTSNYPWVIAGVLKIIYDVLLLYNMQDVRPDVEIEKQKKVECCEQSEIEEIEMQDMESSNEKEWGRGSGGMRSDVVALAAMDISDRPQDIMSLDPQRQ